MASVFSYEPEISLPESPWPPGVIEESVEDVTIRLPAEPQTGPTEYKLHLLLRRKEVSLPSPRRLNRQCLVAGDNITSATETASGTRQHRLEQLTTQLLWRLQQSSSYHSNPANGESSLYSRERSKLSGDGRLGNVIPGLKESKGALYEIGVADDGTLVGLTSQEMNESLNTLETMARSIGCVVSMRRVFRFQRSVPRYTSLILHRNEFQAGLVVAEVFVGPDIAMVTGRQSEEDSLSPAQGGAAGVVSQLRVLLKGAPSSGKSSLLGTISTSMLDNGRGKSRLSLLKYRTDGVSDTKSASTELVGYMGGELGNQSATVLNYANEAISTWSDIQSTPQLSRLAFITDPPGHSSKQAGLLTECPPHCIFLCIAANETLFGHYPISSAERESPNGEHSKESKASPSLASLEVCLGLQLPLVIVITKFDKASKMGLRKLLSPLFTVLKDARRQPVLVANHKNTPSGQSITNFEDEYVRRAMTEMSYAVNSTVLVILSSAVTGYGIQQLHAALRYFPISKTQV